MYRAWSIADGPAELTKGIASSFTLNTGQTVSILITTVGDMHRGATHSFSGQIEDGRLYEVIGTYNYRARTGSCHALTPDAL
jgi:hypothetical protein